MFGCTGICALCQSDQPFVCITEHATPGSRDEPGRQVARPISELHDQKREPDPPFRP